MDQTTTTRTAEIEAVTDAAEIARHPEPGPHGADRRVCSALRRRAGAGDALQKPHRAGNREEVRELRRQRTCGPVHCPCRQGARLVASALPRDVRGYHCVGRFQHCVTGYC